MKLSLLICASLFAVAMATPAAIKPAPGEDGENSKTPAKEGTTDKDSEEAAPQIELPEPLTLENFDNFTSEHIAFVEFFSPYCHHCTALKPKWEQAFRETVDYQNESGVHMRQVNCVESGDLCDREAIPYWPNMRLYVPKLDEEGKNTGKSKVVDMFPRALKQTPENLKKFLKKSVAEYAQGASSLPSSSQQMDTDTMLKIVAGEMEEPWFIGMFSSNNDEWENGSFSRTCMDCLSINNDWDKLSNLIVSSAKAGHLNCKSNPTLCEKLGYPELSSEMCQSPRYTMFLPKQAGLIRFDYNKKMDIQKMKSWITRLAINSQYEMANAGHFENTDLFVTEKPERPLDVELPLETRVGLVFAFEKNKLTKEDKDVLPHLLEMVTNLPFNVRLYASSSVKFEETLEYQSKGLVDFVKSDETLGEITYNRPLHFATTITNKPTLFLFKEHSMVPSVYQNFAPEDMRNPEKIKKWLMKNMYPIFEELTPELFEWYFNTKDKKNDKVVVTFVDGDNEDELKNALYNISLIAHEYTLLKKEYYFKDLMDERGAKWQRVNELKQKGADTAEVIEAMREDVPHLFDHNDALFTYINLRENPELAQEVGWDIDGEGYKPGDTIIVTKNSKYYWDRTLNGEKLTIEPAKLRPVLLHLLDPELTKDVKMAGFKLKLARSPFGSPLRMFDAVYDNLVFSLVIFFIGMIGVRLFMSRYSRRRRLHLKGRGIIGADAPKKD